MTGLGVVLPPQDEHLSVLDLVELGKLAEAEGYDAAFTPEAFAWDAFSLLSAIAMVTERIQLGTSIVTLPVRTPALTAMGAATVDYLSRGRHVLGLGMGHRLLVERWHGLPFEPGRGRMREYVEIIRSAIAREPMDFVGKHLRSTDSEFGSEPWRRRLPIYLAALSLETVRLAGEVADGLLPYYATPDYLHWIVAALHEGAERAGRDPGELTVALLVPTQVTDDVAAAREAARGQLAWYNNFEFYNRMFRDAGFAEAEPLREAWEKIRADPELHRRWEHSRDAEGADAGTAELVSDEMVDSIFVIGDAATCRRRLESYRELGVDIPLVFPQGGDYARTIAEVARAGALATTTGGSNA